MLGTCLCHDDARDTSRSSSDGRAGSHRRRHEYRGALRRCHRDAPHRGPSRFPRLCLGIHRAMGEARRFDVIGAVPRQGAKIAVHGRDTKALARVRSDIEQADGRAIQAVADVTKFAEIEAMRDQIEKELSDRSTFSSRTQGSATRSPALHSKKRARKDGTRRSMATSRRPS